MLASYLIGAIALVFMQPSAAFNLDLANAVCNLLVNDIMIYSGDVCGEYYTCSEGLATLAVCSPGYYFSKDAQSCVPAAQFTCTNIDNPCENAKDGAFVAATDSCSDFYYCNNGVGTKGSCPDGLNFDVTDQSCNYTADFSCSMANAGASTASSINLCAVIPNYKFFASSSSCQAWQECRNGALTVGACASPYYFNVETAACDYKENVSCRQVTNNPSTGTGAGYLAGSACKTNGAITSDGSTCSGYYTCNNNVYSYATCSNELYFNPPTSTCVNRLDAVNDCNRCEDTTLEFVNLYQDNCVGYGYCNKGRMASTGTCLSGYFDEVAQACVIETAEPTYAVCNTAVAAAAAGTTTVGSTTESSTTDSSSKSTATGGDSSSTDGSTTVKSTGTESTATAESTTASVTDDSTSTTEASTTTNLA